MPRLIPVLLSRMVYSQEDIEILEAEALEQNENVPDRPEDIKPIFHKTKSDISQPGKKKIVTCIEFLIQSE